eukprot:snap_masked-scaffold_33-processed-gene-0.27-mRNA-1 protein AED:0.21 eAED:1.00 QI:0/-1/0/1/-1/1/1/0/296
MKALNELNISFNNKRNVEKKRKSARLKSMWPSSCYHASDILSCREFMSPLKKLAKEEVHIDRAKEENKKLQDKIFKIKTLVRFRKDMEVFGSDGSEGGEYIVTPKSAGLVENLCQRYKVSCFVYFTAIDILERFASLQPEKYRKKKSLVSCTCFFIASKFEDIYPVDCSSLLLFCSNRWKVSDILEKEVEICTALSFVVSLPNVATFGSDLLECFFTFVGCFDENFSAEIWKNIEKLLKAALQERNGSVNDEVGGISIEMNPMIVAKRVVLHVLGKQFAPDRVRSFQQFLLGSAIA